MNNWMVPYRIKFFSVSTRNPRWPLPQDNCNMGPYSETVKLFSSETTKHLNANWLECAMDIPLQNVWFCVHPNAKMAATEGHSFNIGSYGTMEMKKIELLVNPN